MTHSRDKTRDPHKLPVREAKATDYRETGNTRVRKKMLKQEKERRKLLFASKHSEETQM